jgi:hypothetical protein
VRLVQEIYFRPCDSDHQREPAPRRSD